MTAPNALVLVCATTILAGSAQAQAPSPQATPTQPQAPAQAQAPARSDDGTYVPPSGVIDGTNVKQFLNSGPVIDATAMEEASIPADNLMQMPAEEPEKKSKREAKAKADLAAGKKPKKPGFFAAVGRGWVNTCNAIGFPVGKNDDIGIDASLSSDLPPDVRQRDGAYNPNK